MNNYVAVVENCYDMYIIKEFIPFRSRYSINEIFDEQTRVSKLLNKGRISYSLLDTGLVLIHEDSPILEILTVVDWYTKYGIGVV